MGLVDTVCIGQLSTTVNLAALGPNTVVFNFFMNGLVFLSYSTMALLGDVQGPLRVSGRQVASEKLGLMFMVGWGCGLLLTFVLIYKGETLLELAGDSPSTESWVPAVAYLRGRCWAMPAVCTVMVCQSAMLAQEDARTPCFATLVMLICNVILDFSVMYWDLGMSGIAWTTVLMQYLGATSLFWLVGRNHRIAPSFKRPSWLAISEALKTSCILFFFKAFKNACFAFTQTSANLLGTKFAAAHQAIWAVWMVAAFCPEPLSQAAQTFLPEWQMDKTTLHRVTSATDIFLFVGTALGIVLGLGAVLLIGFLPGLVTDDPHLWNLMKEQWLPLGLSLILVAPALVFDGVLLARKHFLYCTVVMALNTGIVVVFLEVAKRLEWGLEGVWWALVLLQALRLGQGFGKVACTPVTLRVSDGYAMVPLAEIISSELNLSEGSSTMDARPR